MELGPNQKKWVEALKSGKYKQGKSALRQHNEFCCLGVACDIFTEELGLTIEKYNVLYSYDDCTAYLPSKVSKHLGLKYLAGETHGIARTICEKLSCMNDGGDSFQEIASVLEKNPENYFMESK